jgi:hypothetical protein
MMQKSCSYFHAKKIESITLQVSNSTPVLLSSLLKCRFKELQVSTKTHVTGSLTISVSSSPSSKTQTISHNCEFSCRKCRCNTHFSSYLLGSIQGMEEDHEKSCSHTGDHAHTTIKKVICSGS